MAAGTNAALRRIGDPVVAPGPAAVRIRARIRLSDADAPALTTIGTFLGSVYRSELAGRIGGGVLDRAGQAAWRAQRKRVVTAMSSSRWAGAITRAVEDQYQLGLRGLAAHVAELRAAVAVLAARCVLRPGELAPDAGIGNRSRRQYRGYGSAAERFAKTRRLAVLRARLAAAEEALAAGRPSITVGGGRLWRTRNHLDAADMTEQQWNDRWVAARLFLTADGESGKSGGNETIRVDDRQDPAPDSGRVRALHRPGSTTNRAPRGDVVVPAHRHAHHEACRSTGQHPPPAANTVRAAQDSPLIRNQER